MFVLDCRKTFSSYCVSVSTPKKRHCSKIKQAENERETCIFFFAAPLDLVDSLTPGPAFSRVGEGAPTAPMYRHQVCPGGELTERSRPPSYENHHQERQKCDCDTVIHSSTAVCRSKLTADSSLRTPSFFILSLDTPHHHHLLSIPHVLLPPTNLSHGAFGFPFSISPSP